MQTVTLEITNDNALKVLQELQEKHFINILARPDLNSQVFPGKPLTVQEFKTLIQGREAGPGISLSEAKSKWSKKRKQLLQLAK